MQKSYCPKYLTLFQSGELAHRANTAFQELESCHMCPRGCGANRLENSQHAVCGVGELALVASFGAHLGEEAPLRGRLGSGTIFFSGCNLKCIYCQNYDISQQNNGQPTSPAELASMMLHLQSQGCHNINLVSPSHVVPQILMALVLAVQAGLRVPLVYNTGGYDALETLTLLDGVVDIYMPDIKYAEADTGRRLSGVTDYPVVNQIAVREMHRQVGDLVTDNRGVALQGLLVRHLVLPNDLAGTAPIISFLVEHISSDTYLNLMDQYRPCFQAVNHPEIDRRITQAEYQNTIQMAHKAGLERLDRRLPRNM